MLQDYYDILDLNPGATTDEIRKAYRRKAKLCHPDTCKSPEAPVEFIKLKEAFDILLKRRYLDETIRCHRFSHPRDPYFQHNHNVHSSHARNVKSGNAEENDPNDFLQSKAGYILYIFMHSIFLITGFIILLSPLYSVITRGFDKYASFPYSAFNLIASMTFGVIMIIKISGSIIRYVKKPF